MMYIFAMQGLELLKQDRVNELIRIEKSGRWTQDESCKLAYEKIKSDLMQIELEIEELKLI